VKNSNSSLGRNNSKVYFYTSFIAYVLALFCTIFVMHVFKHAQPALLYIVPLCLILPLTVALIKGDLKSMFEYRDHTEEQVAKSKQTAESTSSSSEPTVPSPVKEKKETKKVK